ncbi:MAG: hypothetical protein HY788_14540 [Deltaproteobacteria bacterium]|nr:hypothetical protein [Deltaproteobacteria bacterium]
MIGKWLLWSRTPILACSLLVISALAPAWGSVDGCRSCHKDVEEIGPSHAFPCSDCHGGNNKADTLPEAHNELVSNPSSLDDAQQRCGPCHRDEVERVRRSLMATAAGIINQTRYVFGRQEKGSLEYATAPVDRLKQVPEPSDAENDLVDDLLRRRCLRCHLGTRGARRFGDFRSEGCAACHVLYADDGLSLDIHSSIDPKEPEEERRGQGHPIRHGFTTRIPNTQCAHCHNGNRVGADYLGLFERDYHEAYRFLSPDGRQFYPKYGLDHHRLLPDVHFEKGLHCIDCHVQSELMGDGNIYGVARDALKVTCRDCHGDLRRRPETVPPSAPQRSNPIDPEPPMDRTVLAKSGDRISNVRLQEERLVLTSKVTGRRHLVPVLLDMDTQPTDHRIVEHMDGMTCHSCHAAWSFQDYGLHLFREDVPRYEKWRPLWAQNDPQIQELLGKNLSLLEEQWSAPVTKDWIDSKQRSGAWYSGWSMRRWDGNVLGRDPSGLVRVFRPQYQYMITWVDGTGTVRLDSVIPRTLDGQLGFAMNPYAPHTIRRQVVRCEGCHLNAKAAGLGALQIRLNGDKPVAVPLTRPRLDGLDISFQLSQMVDLTGRPVQVSTHGGARPFNADELRRLLNPTRAYQKYRLEELGYQ